MSASSVADARLLLPTTRQFPFDEPYEKIVQALSERNWKVPGIQVSHASLTDEDGTVSWVTRIEGDGFILKTNRTPYNRTPEVRADLSSDVMALGTIFIPNQALRVFGDESGPVYYDYDGPTMTPREKKLFIMDVERDLKCAENAVVARVYRGTCYCQSGRVNGGGHTHTDVSRHPYTVRTDKKSQRSNRPVPQGVIYRTFHIFSIFERWMEELLVEIDHGGTSDTK